MAAVKTASGLIAAYTRACGFAGWASFWRTIYVLPGHENNETAGVTRLAQSFNNVTATTELAETVTFIESAWSFNWALSCDIK